jgi:hypothetical protein
MDQVELLEAEKPRTHTERMLPEAGSSSRTPDQPGPSKRQKASHLEVIDISRPSTHPHPRNAVEPLGIPNLKGTRSTVSVSSHDLAGIGLNSFVLSLFVLLNSAPRPIVLVLYPLIRSLLDV